MAAAMQPTTVKALAESSGLTSIPISYNSIAHLNESLTSASKLGESVPVIDFSLLTSSNPDQRSNAVRDLGKACQEWGFFLLVNHGVPESLMKGVVDACDDFFNLSLEEKQEYAGKGYWEPIRFGTGADVKVQKVLLWRDFLKLYVHPEFHAPSKPNDFRSMEMAILLPNVQPTEVIRFFFLPFEEGNRVIHRVRLEITKAMQRVFQQERERDRTFSNQTVMPIR